MPGYLVDEGGERTHAVVPVEEYERLKRAVKNLEAIREHAVEIMSVVSREDELERSEAGPSVPESDVAPGESSGQQESEPRGYGWQS